MLIQVSIGEALDKLTILDIKLTKIQDQTKKKFIQDEFNYLQDLLKNIISKYSFFYQCLKKVNLEIWELQDQLRLMIKSDNDYGKICEKVVLLNDSRFFIKNKINIVGNSQFHEQKGYKKRVAKILYYEIDSLHPAIRFISLFYDEVQIICSEKYIKILENKFLYDPTIKVKNNSEMIYCGNKDIFVPFESEIKTKITHPFLENVSYIFRDKIDLNINNVYKQLNLDPIIYIEYSYN